MKMSRGWCLCEEVIRNVAQVEMLVALKKGKKITQGQITTKLSLIINNLTKDLKDKDGKISKTIDKINN